LLHDDLPPEPALTDAHLSEFRSQARRRRPVMGLVQLDAETTTAHVPSCHQRAAGSCKWIEHHIAWLREGLQQRRENADRLLGRMQLVPGIGVTTELGF